MIVQSTSMPAKQGKPNPYGQQPRQPSFNERAAKQAAIIQNAIATDPRLGQSVNFQIRQYGGYSQQDWERLNEDKLRCASLTNEMRTLRDGVLWQYRQYFESIVANENNNMDMYNGFQWTDQQLKDIQDAGLTPHKSNYMSRWARTLAGEQRGAKTIYKMVNHDDEAKDEADFWTETIYKICRQQRWNQKESLNFFNYFVGGRGFTSVRRDPFDPTRRLKLEVHRPQEFIYDLDNAKDGFLDGCNYLARVYYKDLEDLIHEYPLWETELRQFDHGRYHSRNEFTFTLAQPKVHPTQKKLHLPSKLKDFGAWQSRRSAWTTEFYQRGGRKVWAVRDIQFHIDYPFEWLEQAVEFYQHLRDAYIYLRQAKGLDINIDLVAPPREIVQPQVTQYIWAGDLLLDIQQMKGETFPYQPIHCDFHQGVFRGFLEDDKDNQVLRNRMLVLYDMILSGTKGKTLYNPSYFPKGTEQKDIEEWLVRPTKAMSVKKGLPIGADLSRAIHHEPPPQLGQVPGTITQAIDQASNHLNGGLNVIGQAAFAGQSARHGQQMISQASNGTIQLFDDHQEHGVMVAEAIIQNAQHLDPHALIELTEPSDRERYLQVINNGFQTVADNRYMMEAVEVLSGPTKRDADITMLKELALNDPASTGDIAPEIVTLMGLPNAMSERIQARRKAREDNAQQIAMREQDRMDYAETMKWELAAEDRDIKHEANEIKKNPPVNTSLVFKGAPPGPATVSSILEQNGIESDPQLYAKDMATQKLIEQDERDMMQEHANKLTPEWQKKPAGSGTQGKSVGTRSAKDQIARKSKGPERTS